MIPVAASIAEVRAAVRAAGRVAFVPTMGALHAGHGELVRAARAITDFVVVSVFVNPTQFGPNEDYAQYPRTPDADRDLAEAHGASLVFAPSAATMYPDGATTFVDIGELGDFLCGPSRPGHFRGVCTVVLKLFNIVQPQVAVFGAKDAQQARIIRRIVRDLNVPVELVVAPTVREPDGLAMSSRNRYLNARDRANAPKIYAALQAVRTRVEQGEADVPRLEAGLLADLRALPGVRVDYASIVDDDSLQPVPRIERPALCAAAVFLGATRLIDNITLSPTG